MLINRLTHAWIRPTFTYVFGVNARSQKCTNHIKKNWRKCWVKGAVKPRKYRAISGLMWAGNRVRWVVAPKIHPSLSLFTVERKTHVLKFRRRIWTSSWQRKITGEPAKQNRKISAMSPALKHKRIWTSRPTVKEMLIHKRDKKKSLQHNFKILCDLIFKAQLADSI